MILSRNYELVNKSKQENCKIKNSQNIKGFIAQVLIINSIWLFKNILPLKLCQSPQPGKKQAN